MEKKKKRAVPKGPFLCYALTDANHFQATLKSRENNFIAYTFHSLLAWRASMALPTIHMYLRCDSW